MDPKLDHMMLHYCSVFFLGPLEEINAENAYEILDIILDTQQLFGS